MYISEEIVGCIVDIINREMETIFYDFISMIENGYYEEFIEEMKENGIRKDKIIDIVNKYIEIENIEWNEIHQMIEKGEDKGIITEKIQKYIERGEKKSMTDEEIELMFQIMTNDKHNHMSERVFIVNEWLKESS